MAARTHTGPHCTHAGILHSDVFSFSNTTFLALLERRSPEVELFLGEQRVFCPHSQ